MKLVSTEEMRSIYDLSFTKYGVPTIVLMENAGKNIVDEILNLDMGLSMFTILCGTNHNGGVGFVAARHLQNLGHKVVVFVVGNPKNLSGDAETNFEILKNLEIQIENISDNNGVIKLEKIIVKTGFVIDAIYGMDEAREMTPVLESIIGVVNASSNFTVSVDIPTGIDGDSGWINKVAIGADKTVALSLPKFGNILFPGAIYNGELVVKEICIPKKAIDDMRLKNSIILNDFAKSLMPSREKDSHKGNYGKANVIAGSSGLTGAAILTCRSALRSGLGLLKLYIPESLNILITTSVPEAVTVPLQEMRKGIIGINHINRIIEDANQVNVLAIGPGCGNTSELSETIRRVLLEVERPVVIDADGLNALAKNVRWLSEKKAKIVLTPHPGEMSRLSDYTIEEINLKPIEIAREFATKWDVVLVLKGSRTVVALPNAQVYVNVNGNPGMATAGSGDVLTGIITGLIGQGVKAE
ncbi:MAG: NAD(P)H-hydrate dehydratase, partial [Acidaminobacteraceae bacterium]